MLQQDPDESDTFLVCFDLYNTSKEFFHERGKKGAMIQGQ